MNRLPVPLTVGFDLRMRAEGGPAVLLCPFKLNFAHPHRHSTSYRLFWRHDVELVLLKILDRLPDVADVRQRAAIPAE